MGMAEPAPGAPVVGKGVEASDWNCSKEGVWTGGEGTGVLQGLRRKLYGGAGESANGYVC